MRRTAVTAWLVLALLGAGVSPADAQTTGAPTTVGPAPPPNVCVVPEPGPLPLPTPRPLPTRPFATPPVVAAAPAESAGQSSADAYPFPITRHRVSGLWLEFVRTHGDVDNVGLPRSEVICDPLTGQVVQYFPRVVLEDPP